MIQQVFTIDEVMSIKDTTKDNKVNSGLCSIDFMYEFYLASFLSISQVLSTETQENNDLDTSLSLCSIPKVA